MNASPEVLDLLRSLQNKEIGRAQLAKWLAEYSLRFLDSPNPPDRLVVADLDAALGEIQRQAEPEDYLAVVARRLVYGLMLDLHTLEEKWHDPSFVNVVTASASSGGTTISAGELTYAYA